MFSKNIKIKKTPYAPDPRSSKEGPAQDYASIIGRPCSRKEKATWRRQPDRAGPSMACFPFAAHPCVS